MDAHPVLTVTRRSNTTNPCLTVARAMPISTWVAWFRDPDDIQVRNDTGRGGHSAMAPVTGSFQA